MTTSQQVTFIQNAKPPLVDGRYAVSVTQTIPGLEPGTFSAEATFVVSGERLTIRPAEIDSVFPPSLANGEFGGALPHVVFSRCTLPWERAVTTPGSAVTYPDAPWLAVLVCDEPDSPQPRAATVKDLVAEGTAITVEGSTLTGTGKLPVTTLSYGATLTKLGYGETPDDACMVVDLPVATFDQIAPAAADLAYLAHVREVDTTEGTDSTSASEQHAVVIANRVPAGQGVARAFLVSLEGMADYLPAADGTRSAAIGPSIDTVRLIAYQSWTFTVNDMDQTLAKLLAGLNGGSGDGAITTLMLPISGNVPSEPQIARAAADQADGSVSADDARVLMQNALLMGYLPAGHHLRYGGRTVSFYRGPLVPLPVPSASPAYYSGPDAASAYDPRTGMFDVSYGAAWQLGQLLALQNSGMANQLYQWKRTVTLQQAIAAEDALLTQRLRGAAVFPSFLSRRSAIASDPPPALPGEVVSWFGDLVALRGVPFSYLVPDERMLPPESIRFFHVDQSWVDALIDGAFSIGRAAVSDQSLEVRHAPAVRRLARSAAARRRASLLAVAAPGATSGAPVSGFLLRSAAVAGWPNLRVAGYRDAATADPINAVRIDRLSSDTMLCLFDDVVASMYIREPPEQLHHGVQGGSGGYYTTLRSVTGGPGQVAAGQQYTASPATARLSVPVRADGRTLLVRDAAASIESRLRDDFAQAFPEGFTAAEFALEMTRAVVEMEFNR
jgi:hypothetical protein